MVEGYMFSINGNNMYKWCKIVMPWQGQWVLEHKGKM